MMTVIFMSNATVAAMIALLLDTTLSWGKDGGSNDSGSHWWRKFSSYNSDVRSDEFYALPFKLNKFFPAHWHLTVMTCNYQLCWSVFVLAMKVFLMICYRHTASTGAVLFTVQLLLKGCASLFEWLAIDNSMKKSYKIYYAFVMG